MPQIGYPPIVQTISSTDTYPQFAGETAFTNNRGQIVQAYDSTGTYGAGEFIFLVGVASTAIGDVVTYDLSSATSATTRWDGTANTGKPLAIAMSANVAGQMGWYQIAGLATVNTGGAVTSGNQVFFQATAVVDDAQVNGKQMLGATFQSTTTGAGQALVLMNRPHVQGQTV